MEVSKRLKAIYVEEMYNRVHLLVASLDACQVDDSEKRRAALYDARLEAHTMKGASAQLGFDDAANLGSVMSQLLERASDDNVLSDSDVERLRQYCAAIAQWLDSGVSEFPALTGEIPHLDA